MKGHYGERDDLICDLARSCRSLAPGIPVLALVYVVRKGCRKSRIEERIRCHAHRIPTDRSTESILFSST